MKPCNPLPISCFLRTSAALARIRKHLSVRLSMMFHVISWPPNGVQQPWVPLPLPPVEPPTLYQQSLEVPSLAHRSLDVARRDRLRDRGSAGSRRVPPAKIVHGRHPHHCGSRTPYSRQHKVLCTSPGVLCLQSLVKALAFLPQLPNFWSYNLAALDESCWCSVEAPRRVGRDLPPATTVDSSTRSQKSFRSSEANAKRKRSTHLTR